GARNGDGQGPKRRRDVAQRIESGPAPPLYFGTDGRFESRENRAIHGREGGGREKSAGETEKRDGRPDDDQKCLRPTSTGRGERFCSLDRRRNRRLDGKTRAAGAREVS